jgi:hypothetical protein
MGNCLALITKITEFSSTISHQTPQENREMLMRRLGTLHAEIEADMESLRSAEMNETFREILTTRITNNKTLYQRAMAILSHADFTRTGSEITALLERVAPADQMDERSRALLRSMNNLSAQTLDFSTALAAPELPVPKSVVPTAVPA